MAPIFGEQEFVLAHRDDAEESIYGMQTKLENVNLEKFPMMTFARMWKTKLRPGEVLLLPQGTYQQHCNATACLSYSRYAPKITFRMPRIPHLVHTN